MDKKKSTINISVSIIGKLVILFFTLCTRRLIIKYLGNDINGVNSLYTSIIGFLAVAELGVGSAITFSMYKPIVKNETEKIIALYQLYKRIYLIIGGIILFAGLCIIPFLPYLAKDYGNIKINFSLTFILALIAVVCSYLYSAKTSLINAYKNNYLTSLAHVGGIVIQSCLQILVLTIYRSFELYLIAHIIGTLTQYIITSWIAKRKYKNIIRHEKLSIDIDTKNEIIKNVKAMFLHKVGTVFVNSTDSIIISSVVGLAILGKYSNYTTLITAMISIIILFFTSLTSIVGHMFVKESKKDMESWFEVFYYINYFLAFVCFLGFYSIIDEVIVLFFGMSLQLNKIIVMTITMNYFIQFMRQAALLFRDASGNFYYDRWKPIIEGGVNIILSILLAVILPEDYKVVGVIIATIITNLLICHIVEPHIIYKYAFETSAYKYIVRNYLLIILFFLMLNLFDLLRFYSENIWGSIIINGLISIAISLIVIFSFILLNKDLRVKLKRLLTSEPTRS